MPDFTTATLPSTEMLSLFLIEAAREIGEGLQLQWRGNPVLPSEAFGHEGLLPLFVEKINEIAAFCMDGELFESSPGMQSMPSPDGLLGVSAMPLDDRPFSWVYAVIAFHALNDTAARSPAGVIEFSNLLDPINPYDIVEHHVAEKIREKIHAPVTAGSKGSYAEYDWEADEI